MALVPVALGVATAGVAGLAYAAGYEARSYRLQRRDIPVLQPGSRPLRVLHLSDLHMTPQQRRKVEWVRGLAALEPDIVVNTGDNIAHLDAVATALEALEPLLSVPGVFVFGSNDYFAPQFKNPARYLLPIDKMDHGGDGPELPWRDLRDAFVEAGWLDLNNARGALTVDGRRLAFAGVDDPHLERDRLDAVLGQPDSAADLTIGVMHAPYLRVLDALHADGCELLLAGHTHGGQLCVPGFGALVTNCDLDRDRAKGVSRHPAAGGSNAAWLHVCAGLGTSPFAPVRFACPPEAVLLTLLPR